MDDNYFLQSNYLEAKPQRWRLTLPTPFTWGTYRVWQRNRDAFLRRWKTELWPPFVETIMTLLAFGFGIGVYIQGQVEGMSYLQFIAPGLIMSSVLFTATFECMFGTYIRMKIEKMFDATLATPITLEEVVSGEITWAATRATFTGSCVLLVLAPLNLLPNWWVVLLPLLGLITGFMMASLAIIVTSLVPSINAFNYFITLGVVPMQLFSDVFFSVSQIPENLRWLVYFSPLYPATRLARAIFVGQMGPELLGYLLWISLLSLVFYSLALRLMRHRLIK
ncbi:MAG: ABC transporter permease [Chloroflexota bacterium]|nr:ABC transporter permease [Chloroflexota bacterium]